MNYKNELKENLDPNISENISIVRQPHLAQKIVFVDGQPGCGKTMLSPIIAALDRVELLTYAYEIEYICSLKALQKIEMDAAVAMVRMLTDLQIYNTMMGRETNFRPNDLSSIFKDANPWRYIKRIFQKGDVYMSEKIANEKPILHLTTHNLLGMSDPVLSGLGERCVVLEVVRHPLYMIKQQALNMRNLIENERDFTIYYQSNGRNLPYWTHGYGDDFFNGNDVEKSIYSMVHRTELTEKKKKYFEDEFDSKVITIPFECFVINPWDYMKQIEDALDTKMTNTTRRILKKQKVPRAMYADGVNSKTYQRYGFRPPVSQDENEEFRVRWAFAKESASQKALDVLEQICTDYEQQYLGGKKEYR